jgi:hypothetical protein
VRQPPIHCTLVAEPWSRAPIGPVHDDHHVRARVEIMGSQTCRIVGKSQSVLMMINPIISTRPYVNQAWECTVGNRCSCVAWFWGMWHPLAH